MELNPSVQVDMLGFRFGARSVFERFSLTLPGGVTWLRGSNGKGKPVRLLLLDEPFNGLDAPAALYLRRQLAERAVTACIVLASHVDPQLALARTVELDGGDAAAG